MGQSSNFLRWDVPLSGGTRQGFREVTWRQRAHRHHALEAEELFAEPAGKGIPLGALE